LGARIQKAFEVYAARPCLGFPAVIKLFYLTRRDRGEIGEERGERARERRDGGDG
jgi:hypothetical protein